MHVLRLDVNETTDIIVIIDAKINILTSFWYIKSINKLYVVQPEDTYWKTRSLSTLLQWNRKKFSLPFTLSWPYT